MRRLPIAAAIAAVIVIVLPTRPAAAACESPPRIESRAGARAIRNTPLVAWGIIDRRVPKNAHGRFSFLLEVRTYFRGAGPSTIEVTDYGDREIALAGLRPGGSVAPSRAFIDRQAGEQAVVFASPEQEPFLGGYATDRCTYTTYGSGNVSGVLRRLRRTLGPGRAPEGLPRTGDPLLGLAGIGAALVIAGEFMRRAAGRAGVPEFVCEGEAAIAFPDSPRGADSAPPVHCGLIGPNIGPFPHG